mmetsp:Transcript_20345/g.28249  ORF Transcript_20345/g.28249 Transcript_20345/m.28249 type:complete len:83 (+) Transcript_20345:1778-2026(+)
MFIVEYILDLPRVILPAPKRRNIGLESTCMAMSATINRIAELGRRSPSTVIRAAVPRPIPTELAGLLPKKSKRRVKVIDLDS